MRLFSNDRLAMAADEKVPFVFLLVPGTGTHEVGRMSHDSSLRPQKNRRLPARSFHSWSSFELPPSLDLRTKIPAVMVSD